MNKNKLKRALALCCMVAFAMMPCSSMPVLAADTAAESTAELTVWDGTSDTTWYDSQATELHIQTAEQLAGLATLVNGGKSMEGQTICMDNDILLNDTSDYEDWETTPPVNEWKPIGQDSAFSGVFDGGGYTIEGMYIKPSEDAVDNFISSKSLGLFAMLNSPGEITQISVKDALIIDEYNHNHIGGICGYTDSGVSLCSFDGKIISNGGNCGGIVGLMHSGSVISGCCNYGEIIGITTGGIVGYIINGDYCSIENCSNYGDICGSSYAGGIVAYSYRIDVNTENCYNRGDVSSEKCAGGIYGEFYGPDVYATLTNVYNTGTITCSGSSEQLGALVGTEDATRGGVVCTNCYYLTSGSMNGIGGEDDTDQIIAKNEANMKTEEFAAALGSAFLYSPGDYPILAQNNASFDVTSLTMDEYLQQKTLTLSTNYEGEPIWVSGDTSIATVENGVVTALKNGTTTIYAICGDAKAECTVTVDYSYYLNETELALSKGDTAKLAVYSEATKLPTENLDIVWTSSAPDVVTVDETGAVTAVAAGSAEITAAFLEFELVCSVTVTESAAVSLSPTEAAMQVGETLALTISGFEGTITWVSTDTQVATVDANGVITAAAEGESVIYAILSTGTTLSCNVTVTASAETVLGDVNLDGSVGVLDVVALQRYLLADLALDDAQFVQADMNADGAVNVFDLALLKKAVLAK